jgi:hypothetical protein
VASVEKCRWHFLRLGILVLAIGTAAAWARHAVLDATPSGRFLTHEGAHTFHAAGWHPLLRQAGNVTSSTDDGDDDDDDPQPALIQSSENPKTLGFYGWVLDFSAQRHAKPTPSVLARGPPANL